MKDKVHRHWLRISALFVCAKLMIQVKYNKVAHCQLLSVIKPIGSVLMM